MQVSTGDGATFAGKDAAEVVEAMRRDQWTKPEPTCEYMVGVRARVREMTGVEVRIDTPANLLSDLVSAGLLAYGPPVVVAADFGDEKP
jgi:hypothetical protein